MKEFLYLFKTSPLFSGMSDDEILDFLDCTGAQIIQKQKNEYILREGETTDCIGMLLTGSAVIVQEDLWGHRNVISKIQQGNLFAEPFAIIKTAVLNVSVISEHDSKILMLDISKPMPYPLPIRNLVLILSEKLLLFNDKITHMSKRKTRDKLLSYLSAESVRQGKLSFDIPFDRQQLADFLCVERSAMSFEISKLQKEGILKTNKNHFELFTKI